MLKYPVNWIFRPYMSTGNFIVVGYSDNQNRIWKAYVQPETLTLTVNGVSNAAATGAPTLPTLDLKRSSKARGLLPRQVTVQLTADGSGAAQGLRKGTRHTIVCFRRSAFDACVPGRSGTYQGIPCVVFARRGEIQK